MSYPDESSFDHACWRCIREPAIQRFILARATSRQCSYCGKRYHVPKAIRVEKLIQFIQDAIEAEYEDAANSVGYDSQEGGYLLPTTDTSDLLEEYLEDVDEDLFNDIVSGFPDVAWVHQNPYSSTDDEQFWFDWEYFCRFVKHQNRYFFLRVPKHGHGDPDSNPTPAEILKRLGRFAEELRLIRTLPKERSFHRVRCHGVGTILQSPGDLGPPPCEHAKYANRMSPAGIPMFYGATSVKTAVLETWDPGNPNTPLVTAGKFATVKPFKVLDLTRLPAIPSIFDRKRCHERPLHLFFHEFVRDLTKPVKKDGHEHIDYVPTQVVAEYFRHIHVSPEGERVRGIIYPSAKHKGGSVSSSRHFSRNSMNPSRGRSNTPRCARS